MDCRLNAKIKAVVGDLAREHQQELAEAGTLVDLEELTCQIGDEVARQLCQHELFGRAEQAAKEEIAMCPECGEPCMAGQPEPALLQGLRGELAYNQPSYYCRHCRRAFFPDGGIVGSANAEHCHAERVAEDGLGGKPLGQLRDGRKGDA
jgi:hypothetical protein